MKCKDCNYWYADEDEEYGFAYCHFDTRTPGYLAPCEDDDLYDVLDDSLEFIEPSDDEEF